MNFHNNPNVNCLVATLLIALSIGCAFAQTPPKLPQSGDPVEELDMTSTKRSLIKLIPRTSAVLYERDNARKYMLQLINRDRASVGAPQVVLDEIASRAAQEHSDEMATNGYLGHWGLDGRKPDQRYSEAGGRDSTAENAFGFTNAKKSALSQAQHFPKVQLDEAENAFFGEIPPKDGHRKNIINPVHNAVGIGLSLANSNMACVQEFINHYGDYSEIPGLVKHGQKFKLTGRLRKEVRLHSVELRWEQAPKPMTVAEINKTYSYSLPKEVTAEYRSGDDKYPIKISNENGCEEFEVDVVVGKEWKPGLYYLLVLARVNGTFDRISTRTFLLATTK